MNNKKSQEVCLRPAIRNSTNEKEVKICENILKNAKMASQNTELSGHSGWRKAK